MTVLRRAPYTFRRLYSSSHGNERVTIGIRREDPKRIWERRCPLTPEAVSELVEKEGVRVLVESCERRVWTSKELLQVSSVLCTTSDPETEAVKNLAVGRRRAAPDINTCTHYRWYQRDSLE